MGFGGDVINAWLPYEISKYSLAWAAFVWWRVNARLGELWRSRRAAYRGAWVYRLPVRVQYWSTSHRERWC